MTRTKLADGVYLTYLPARKFKTSLLSAQFVTPLRKETASAYALLPAVLRRGTVSYPDMGVMASYLDQMYGARVDYTIRKKGENQCVGFVASMIDDSYALGGERLLEPVAALLGELICEPVTKHGRFIPAYFESEKTNLIDAIRSLINDKREYADSRLLREMCAGEPYGISRLGDEESVEKLQPKKLYALYKELIATSRLELFYSGSASLKRVEQALLSAFATMHRDVVQEIAIPQEHMAREEILRIEDAIDVTELAAQGNDALATMMNHLVAINGLTVAPSTDAEGNEVAYLYKWDGSGSQGDDLYFNVAIGEQVYTFTINVYMIGTGADSDVYKAVEALQVGDTINVEGFLNWYNGAQPHVTAVAPAK